MKKTGMMVLLALLAAGVAGAEVVYQDDFSGSGASTLNGTITDIGNGTWTGPTDDMMADGSVSGTGNKTAILPITIESNKIYTISFDLDVGTMTGTYWAMLSLATSPGSVNTYPAQAGYFSYLQLNTDGSAKANTGGVSAYTTATGLYSGAVQMSIVIDTTAATWAYTYQMNGSPILSNSGAAAHNGTIYLRIGHASFSPYTLENMTVKIAEPSEGDIYAEDFSGSAASYLNGTVPDIRPGYGVWSAPTDDMMADGSVSGAANRTAVLPFLMGTGKVYTISLDLDIGALDSGSDLWAMMALATSAGGVTTHPAGTGSLNYLLLRRNGAARALTGGATSGVAAADTSIGLYSDSVELTMVVDTTGEDWVYDYQVDGSSILTNSGPANNGTVYLRIGNYAGFGAYTLENLSVSTPGGDTDYFALWTADYPGIGTATNMLDDPDGDGLNNLSEWALGGNPADAGDIGNAPVAQIAEIGGTNWLEYVYVKRNDADSLGLTYWVEHNTSLQISSSWTNSDVEVLGTGVLDADFDVVTNRVSTEVESKQFLRLRVESN